MIAGDNYKISYVRANLRIRQRLDDLSLKIWNVNSSIPKGQLDKSHKYIRTAIQENK